MGRPDPGLALLQAENERLNAEVVQLIEQLRALEAARDRYAELYDFVSAACLTLDRNGLITEANRRTVSLVRYDRLRLLGAPLMTLVIRQHRRSFLEHLAICKKVVDAVTFDISLAPSEGPPIPVRVTLRSAGEAQGGYTVAMADMRALACAEAEQRRLVIAERAARIENQVKSRFITTVATELRGLLGAVSRAGSTIAEREDLELDFRMGLEALLKTVSLNRVTSARSRPRQSGSRSLKLTRTVVLRRYLARSLRSFPLQLTATRSRVRCLVISR